ncbi:MAG: OmpA family protein [Paracoccus sp. (in: a-proteobacteria)]|uniref:OmpA family protein n=1 Tax=Paracoccus sp. TaxID=267 RepID=UPI003918F984
MRRIIHNTTAIAACLSLLAPQLAMAELRITDDEAAIRAAAQAGTRPDEAAALQAELDDGLEAGTLECADGSERPCADDIGLVTPGGIAVDLSEGGAIVLADADGDTAAAESDGMPVAEGEVSAEDLAAALAAEEVASGDAAEMTEAEEAAPPPEAEAMAEAEAAPEAVAEPEVEVVAEAEVVAEPVAEPDVAPDAATGADDETDLVDELARALSGDAQPETEAPAATDDSAAEDMADDGAVRLARGQVQQDRARNLPGLARVLDEELAAGLEVAALTCIDSSTPPCDGRSMTPRGVVIETNDIGEYRLAPVTAQMYRVDGSGEMVLRAAEEDTPETEASREAAAGSAPSGASALEAEEGSGEVTEQQVTEDSARSSSEDFQTNLRDALSGAVQGQAEPSSGGGNNDLTRALLLGLGAVAVGTVLNNNRQVALSAPDRVVVTRADGSQEVIKDEVALLRQPGSTVTTENFDDGSSRTIVTREDGSRVVTIRDADLRVLRRTLVSTDGTSTRLIDDTADVQPVDVTTLPAPATVNAQTGLNEDELRAALQRQANVDRRFTLSQVRNIPEVRALVAPVNIDAITFDTGSAAVRPDQAQQLATLGRIIQEQVRANPREIFLIEGHTDTVGSEAYNLALSDRRAETVALALAEYFAVPPENLVTQGYGEQFLLIRQEGDIRNNRRASVRRITDLLAQ